MKASIWSAPITIEGLWGVWPDWFRPSSVLRVLLGRLLVILYFALFSVFVVTLLAVYWAILSRQGPLIFCIVTALMILLGIAIGAFDKGKPLIERRPVTLPPDDNGFGSGAGVCAPLPPEPPLLFASEKKEIPREAEL